MAFNGSLWERRVKLTGLIPSVTLDGFIALIQLVNVPLEAVDGGELSALVGGGDLRFSLDRYGADQLPLEVVDFVPHATEGNRRCQLVVRFPAYAPGYTSVWMFHGKAGETQPAVNEPFGRNAVYTDRGYQYNLYDANSIIDSAGATTPIVAGAPSSDPASPFGWGVQFGEGEFIDLGSLIGDTVGDFTLRCWVKAPVPDISSYNTFIASRRAGGGDNYQWRTRNENFTLRIAGEVIHAVNSLLAGVWYQLVVSVESDVIRFYTDGQIRGAPSVITGVRGLSEENTYIGAYDGSTASEIRTTITDVSYTPAATPAEMVYLEYENRIGALGFWTTGLSEPAAAEVKAQDRADNLSTYYQNPALNRTGDVPVADWGSGMNKGGSCSAGIGIATGSVSVPTPAQFTILDQAGEARTPQNSQNMGQEASALNVVQGADVNDTVNFVTATQQADPDAIYDVATGTTNRTDKSIEVDDTAWGTKDE